MDTIKKVKLPEFIPTSKAKPKGTTKTPSAELVKEISNSQKTIDIARSRGFSISEILEPDLLRYNPLFDEDDTRKPDKHVLTKELEKYISDEHHFTKSSDLQTTLVVDFMSLLRRLPLGKMNIFKDLLVAAWNNLQSICAFQRADIVFDSYTNKAIKEGERQR